MRRQNIACQDKCSIIEKWIILIVLGLTSSRGPPHGHTPTPTPTLLLLTMSTMMEEWPSRSNAGAVRSDTQYLPMGRKGKEGRRRERRGERRREER